MDCRAALPLLLEAEPDELAGLAETPLAAHVRGCAPCRARAEAVLDGQRALAAVLDQPARSGDAFGPPRPDAPARDRPPVARRAARPAFRRVALAAGALAFVAVLLLRLPERAPVAPPVPDLPPPPVRVMAGGPVAVFETGRPDVTLVWTY